MCQWVSTLACTSTLHDSLRLMHWQHRLEKPVAEALSLCCDPATGRNHRRTLSRPGVRWRARGGDSIVITFRWEPDNGDFLQHLFGRTAVRRRCGSDEQICSIYVEPTFAPLLSSDDWI